MQPYFIPYLGYFRLFTAADLFVAYDCVQFPRRGWVHRNRLNDINRCLQWLTLPLKKGDRDTTRICDLEFPDTSSFRLEELRQRFPAIHRLEARFPDLTRNLFNLAGSPTDYIISILGEMLALLDIECPIIRSSSLDIPTEIRGQERIITIAQQLNATQYINAPGGRELYDDVSFHEAGLTLHFLEPHIGKFESVVERLAFEDLSSVQQEIQRNTLLTPSLVAN